MTALPVQFENSTKRKGREKNICFNEDCDHFKRIKFSNCTMHISFHTKKCYDFKDKNKAKWGEYKQTNQPDSYNFRGPLNLNHLMNDALKDNKNAFLVIGKDNAIIGISKRLNDSHLIEFRNLIHRNPDNELNHPFHIYVIDKKLVSKVLPFLQKVTSLIIKDIRKIERKLYKDKKAGKFSNQPLKKVMVF